jgi:hypothetical protein
MSDEDTDRGEYTIYVNPASRLGAEFGHLSGVGQAQHHDAGGRDAADGP